MCGISGVAGRTPLGERERVAVGRAADAMQHRGPDGKGAYDSSEAHEPILGGAYLAMRRLSIIDLEGGWQPHKNEDGSVVAVVNGEIYNYVELRAELLERGHRLKTASDCEVLVHLYEELGCEFVHKLQGMFAFALWDTRERRLVLGRDRLGEKPLYLHETKDRIWFASELRSLLATGVVPMDLDPAGIHAYLHYGWIPEPASIFSAVRKLAPGHLLIVDVDRWRIQETRYWRIEDAPARSGDAVELVRNELEGIGKRIVRADVPIGIALSGGFDSSLVAALAAKHSAGPVRAYTVGYEGRPPQDERDLAGVVAAELGLQHRTIEIANSEMVADFPHISWVRDDPIADIAGYGYFKVSKYARADGCPVLLQGQGADELQWGYPWTIKAVQQTISMRNGESVGGIRALVDELPSRFSRPDLVRFAYLMGGFVHGWRTLKRSNGSAHDIAAYELTDSYQIGRRAAASTYTPEFARSLGKGIEHTQHDLKSSLRSDVPVDIQTIALLCRGYLLQNGLAQGDRLSMANSIELRLPLVDYKLVELLVGLQKHSPMFRLEPKRLLREAGRRLVPECVYARPKRPFSPPSVAWLNELRKRYGGELRSGALVEQRILNRTSAANLAERQSRFGTGNDLFFKYLVLEFWYRGMRNAYALAA